MASGVLPDRRYVPESLDQLLVAVTPRAAATVLSLCLLLVGGVVWSIIARIPMTIEGSGILLKPSSIQMVQANGSGKITSIEVRIGDAVAAGTVIARIAQPELEIELQTLKAKYLAVRSYSKGAIALAERKLSLETQLVDEAVTSIQRDVQSARDLQKNIYEKLVKLNEVQHAELQRTRTLLEQLKVAQNLQYEKITQLINEGVTSGAQQLVARAGVTDTESRIADIVVRSQQASLDRIEAEQRALQLNREIVQLEGELRQHQVRRQQAQQAYDADVQQHTLELKELAASIRLIKEKLYHQSVVRSHVSGNVFEISTAVGQIVSAGSRIAIVHAQPQQPFYRIEIEPETTSGVLRLSMGDRVSEPVSVDASHAEVERILGQLTGAASLAWDVTLRGARVADGIDISCHGTPDEKEGFKELLSLAECELLGHEGLPALAAVSRCGDFVPNEDLQHFGFFPTGVGKKIMPEMRVLVSPLNVERQRFGSIQGTVRNVSPYPLTAEAAVVLVGNTDIARTLIDAGGAILVRAELESDPSSPTRLRWTAGGPATEITSGTLTQCRVAVERRAPITFVVPLLREWFLGDADAESRRRIR